MSFLMYARPAPTDLPVPEEFVSLKYAVAQRWFDHDGSLRGDYITVKPESIPFLEGVVAATGNLEIRQEARAMIQMIQENPQGVHVWIGEVDDFDH